MPSMLDARVSLSLMDVVRGENQFEEEFEWVEADEVVDICPVLGKECFPIATSRWSTANLGSTTQR